MSNDELARGIREALTLTERTRRIPTPLDVAQEALAAQTCVETNIEGLAGIPIPTNGSRHLVAFQLLRASLDYARALLYLLATHPADMSAVALGIHRPQIELFLRAVFVQFIADDEQFEDFLREDRGPRRRNPKGKWEAITFKALALEVEATIARLGHDDGPQKLARTVSNAWDPLCGLVHGGRAVQALYRDDNGMVGAHVSAEVLFQTTNNAVATANLCVVVGLAASGIGAFEKNDAIERIGSEFERYLRGRRQRMARMALKP